MYGEGSKGERVVIPIEEARAHEVPNKTRDRMKDLGIELDADGETITSPAVLYYVHGSGKREPIVPKKIELREKNGEHVPWLVFEKSNAAGDVREEKIRVTSYFITSDVTSEDSYLINPQVPPQK